MVPDWYFAVLDCYFVVQNPKKGVLDQDFGVHDPKNRVRNQINGVV